MSEEKTLDVETVKFANKPKLFGKWDYDEVKINDPCFKDYVAVATPRAQVYVPHTAGRYQRKRLRKAQCPIVERMACAMMFHGRNTGKKLHINTVLRSTFEIIHLLTGKNPLAVFVGAVQNGGTREDFTRVSSGGVVRQQAVDVAPLRRVNEVNEFNALHNIAKGARDHCIKKHKTLAEALAEEVIACDKSDGQKSYAIKKRDEMEKVAKGCR